DRTRRGGAGGLRSVADFLWSVAQGVLLRRPRPDAAQPPGPRRRNSVSLRDFLRRLGPATIGEGLYRTVAGGQIILAAHRDRGCSAKRVLSRGGLPPELSGAASREHVHRHQRPAQDRRAAQTIPRSVREPLTAIGERPRGCAVLRLAQWHLPGQASGVGRAATVKNCGSVSRDAWP